MARLLLLLLLSVFTIFMLSFPPKSVILKLRPVHRHENGPAWTFPGRPAVAAHRALAGFRGGSGQARQTGRSHAGWRARRMAGNHRRPSGPGIAAGSLLHGVVTSLGWDFCGMGSLRDGISATSLGITEVRLSLQAADRYIRPRYGATRSGAASTAVRIC